MGSARKKRRELRLVLDTSVAFTQAASDLTNPELKEAILQNFDQLDLKMRWFMPEVVVMERRYRMIERAKTLLPGLEKVEKLLGHNLGITSETLVDRVDRAIKDQLSALSIEVLQVRYGDVDWHRFIEDAAMRRPPFESGEREKGFRDALILESVAQLHADSPRSPGVCRVVLVSNDNLLVEASRLRLGVHQNFQVAAGLEELRSLVNTLGSEVDEEFVNELRGKAATLFFQRDVQETVWYKEQIWRRISEAFGDKLRSVPPAAQYSRAGQIRISPATFVKKSGQRMLWATQVVCELESFKKQQKVRSSLADLLGTGNPTASTLSSLFQSYLQPSQDQKPGAMPQGQIGQALGDELEEVRIRSGRVTFEVHWSATVTRGKALGRASVEAINFVEVVWD